MGTSLHGGNTRYARFVDPFGVPFAKAGVASVTLRSPTAASGRRTPAQAVLCYRGRPAGRRGVPAVHLRLHSADGDALLEASAPTLEAFLAAAWSLVPPGTEHEHIDVDDVLGSLLGDS